MKKYAIINNNLNIIKLSNNLTHQSFYEILLEDYKITPNQKIIKGMALNYIFDIYKETPIENVDPTELIPNYYFGIFLSKKKKYKSGWVLLKKRKYIKISNPKGFIIYEEDENNI